MTGFVCSDLVLGTDELLLSAEYRLNFSSKINEIFTQKREIELKIFCMCLKSELSILAQ